LKIRLEQAENAELEVIIKGDVSGKEAVELLASLRAPSFGKIMLKDQDESYIYNAGDIVYFVCEQGKTYAVCESGKYQVKEKLYELCEAWRSRGFVQISKSTAVNIHYVKSISAEFSGNYIAKLKNRSESLIISRKFYHSFREYLRR